MSEIFNLELYKSWVSEKSFNELSQEKTTLGNLISDTAGRIQDLSGGDAVLLEKAITELKELRQKLSIVIRQLQKLREEL